MLLAPIEAVIEWEQAGEPYHANYDIAPDGRSFVFVRQSGGNSLTDVAVVLNWFQAAARARTP